MQQMEIWSFIYGVVFFFFFMNGGTPLPGPGFHPALWLRAAYRFFFFVWFKNELLRLAGEVSRSDGGVSRAQGILLCMCIRGCQTPQALRASSPTRRSSFFHFLSVLRHPRFFQAEEFVLTSLHLASLRHSPPFCRSSHIMVVIDLRKSRPAPRTKLERVPRHKGGLFQSDGVYSVLYWPDGIIPAPSGAATPSWRVHPKSSLGRRRGP